MNDLPTKPTPPEALVVRCPNTGHRELGVSPQRLALAFLARYTEADGWRCRLWWRPTTGRWEVFEDGRWKALPVAMLRALVNDHAASDLGALARRANAVEPPVTCALVEDVIGCLKGIFAGVMDDAQRIGGDA